jgi:hypothetical protein
MLTLIIILFLSCYYDVPFVNDMSFFKGLGGVCLVVYNMHVAISLCKVLIYSHENISERKIQVLSRSVEPLQDRVMVFCACELASALIISLL